MKRFEKYDIVPFQNVIQNGEYLCKNKIQSLQKIEMKYLNSQIFVNTSKVSFSFLILFTCFHFLVS